MTGADVGSFASMIAASVLVMALIVIGVPALARVLFRYRVEALRDECVDAIFDGKLRPESSAELFIRSTEQIEPRVRRLTLLRALTLYMALVRAETPGSALPAPRSYPELEPGEEQVMSGLERRYANAFWSYLRWGSATAWIIAPLLMMIFPLLKVTFRRANPKANIVTGRKDLPKEVLTLVTRMQG